MLQANPTESGTGISIYGDYADLDSLYETVHHIEDSLDEDNAYQRDQHMLLMNFAYEIRHAYQGTRLVKEMRFDDDYTHHYYGFQLVWTDLLIFTNALRNNAAYIQTDKLNQANLYLLEYVVEKALHAYDPTGAAEIQRLIGRGIDVNMELTFFIYQTVHVEFVSGRAGKPRFRKIPQLLQKYFSSWSPEHKQMLHRLSVSAKANNCEMHELQLSHFPVMKW